MALVSNEDMKSLESNTECNHWLNIIIKKTRSLDNAIQDFFIGLAIMVYHPIYHNL